MTYEQQLEALSKDTTSLFLCEWVPDGAHSTLVTGAIGVAKQYWLDGLLETYSEEIGIVEATKELFSATNEDCNEEWIFGQNGTASLELAFEDGTWRCSKVTEHKLIDPIKAALATETVLKDIFNITPAYVLTLIGTKFGLVPQVETKEELQTRVINHIMFGSDIP